MPNTPREKCCELCKDWKTCGANPQGCGVGFTCKCHTPSPKDIEGESWEMDFYQFIDNDANWSDKDYGCMECGGGLKSQVVKDFIRTLLFEEKKKSYEEGRKSMDAEIKAAWDEFNKKLCK